jgi:hypothetical protein
MIGFIIAIAATAIAASQWSQELNSSTACFTFDGYFRNLSLSLIASYFTI